MKEVLAIIPARTGSKRLPGKNTRLLAGKPLIEYTFDAAKGAKTLTRVIVVSDDEQVKALALKHGLQYLHEPALLARDDAPMTEVIQWTLVHLQKVEGYRPLFVCLLQPTSPLRTSNDIDAAVEIVTSNRADSVTSTYPSSEFEYGKQNGAAYVMGWYLAINGMLYSANLYRYEMPAERSIDIDTEADFQEAERLIKEGASDHSGELHQLARSGRSKGDDTRRPRGRPRKSK